VNRTEVMIIGLKCSLKDEWRLDIR
jgi:hypothetical protein